VFHELNPLNPQGGEGEKRVVVLPRGEGEHAEAKNRALQLEIEQLKKRLGE